MRNPSLFVVAAMKFNENLQELWLGSNHLGPEDGQHLGSILRTNHTLRILDVRDNNLQDAGVRYICAGIAEQIEGLHILNLTSNNIGHEGFHHVSAMLVSQSLPPVVAVVAVVVVVVVVVVAIVAAVAAVSSPAPSLSVS